MTLIPALDSEQILFETHVKEESPSEPHRKGLHVGNRLTCALPVALDLIEFYAESNQQLPPDIKLQTQEYEFWLLRLGWTLHPASHASVDWVEFRVETGYYTFIPASIPRNHLLRHFDETISSPDAGIGLPVAYDLYPVKVTDEKQIEQTVKLSPSLKFQGVSVSPGEAGIAVKYKQLCPKITAYGGGEAEFYWRFLPGTGDTVEEGFKEMDVILKKKRNTIVGGKILMKGKGTKWGIIPDNEEPEATMFYL